MDAMAIYFDSAAGVYRFIDSVEAEDSGVEELPFASYLTLEGFSEDLQTFDDSQQSSIMFSTKCDHDDLAYIDNDGDDELAYVDDRDELAYVDDDRDHDYHPYKSSSLSKKSKTRPYKRHHYSSSTFLNDDSSLFTPEKQLGQTSDADSNDSSLRLYARKDRTPQTIRKMMERHRESERIRHHSLNESLKDVCLRVPGYDPHAKETKVIQMQRIIGYECFLENTLRDLCDQTGIAAKLMKINTHYITDAIRNTPMEEFYQPDHFKTSENDEDATQDTSTIVCRRNDHVPPECMVIPTSSADKNIFRYRQEKISSPTVDSTTDSINRINPLPTHEAKYEAAAQAVFGETSSANSGKHALSFIPIGPPSLQGLLFSSPESGIKVETQSSYDNDDDFRDVESLIDHCLVHEKVPTPSFMKEETVTTSTSADEDDVFDLSSPMKNTENVFLYSPPSRGIWHPVKRLHLHDKVNTPGGKEMVSISPENILETKPKYTMLTPSVHTSNMFRSNIRPMTEILTRTSTTSGTVGTNPYMPSSKSADVLSVGSNGLHKVRSYCGSKTGAVNSTVHPLGNVFIEGLGYPLRSVKTEGCCCPFENVCTDEHCQVNMQQYSEDKKDSVLTEMNTHYTDIYDPVMLVGSPEVKNKRKRYFPLKLPFLDVTNKDDSDEGDINGSQFKVCKILKRSNDNQYPVTCLQPAFVTSTRSGTDWRTNISVSIMDDNISASQGVPAPHMQKNLGQAWREVNSDDQLDGQVWREISTEDQLPKIETARQCCSFLKDCHTKSLSKCTSTLADSSTTEGQDVHFDNRS